MLADTGGFEPPDGEPSTVFKAAGLDRSPMSPCSGMGTRARTLIHGFGDRRSTS